MYYYAPGPRAAVCPRTGVACPRTPCPGEIDTGVCRSWAALDRHRRSEPPEAIRRPPNTTGRPRVGLIGPCLNQGGAETWQRTLISATRDRLDWQGLAVWLPEAKADPVALWRARQLGPVSFGQQAIRQLAGQCDVLVSWLLEDLEPILTGVEPPPRIIYCDHFPHDEPYDAVTVACLATAQHLVGVSELCQPGFPPEFANRSSVIWNAVDHDRLSVVGSRDNLRPSWGVPNGILVDGRERRIKVAGYYSRVSPEKRPDAMVRLAGSLPADWHVVIVGDSGGLPGFREAFAASIDQLPEPVRERIHWQGPNDAAANVLASFDVLVVPAAVESFGLTMAEGIVAGVPVVSTPVGLAKINPGLTEPFPVDAPGEVLARAVLAAYRDGPRPGAAAYLRDRASPERFGVEWSDLVERIAAIDPETPRILAAVDVCLHGQSANCGCNGQPRTCNRSGEPVLVDRAMTCFECQTPRPFAQESRNG